MRHLLIGILCLGIFLACEQSHAAVCSPLLTDTDGDSVPDVLEDLDDAGADCDDDDTDGNGLPNYLDPDDDGDGIYTIDEDTGDGDPTNDDHDIDGTPNYLDSDSDGDGVSDATDQCYLGDTGWISDASTDNDGDGCRDATEDPDGGTSGPSIISIRFDDLETADSLRHQIPSYSDSGVTFRMEGDVDDGIWYGGQASDVYQGSAAIYVRTGYLSITAPAGKVLAGINGLHPITFDYHDLCGGDFGLPNGLCPTPDQRTDIQIETFAEDGSYVGIMPYAVLEAGPEWNRYEIPSDYLGPNVHRILISTGADRQFDNFSFNLGGSTPSSPPDISVAPTILAFGDVAIGSQALQDVTVTNLGEAELQIGSVGSTNGLAPPFSFGTDTCSGSFLLPLDTCVVTVVYQAATADTLTDSFNIPSNDPDSPDLSIQVSGTGVLVPKVGGYATGITIHTVNCQNKTTRKKVKVDMSGGETTWDCEAAGLVVSPGDQIDMTVKGYAN